MKTVDRTAASPTSNCTLAHLRRSHLAQAISLVLASVFSLRVIEAEAEDNVTETDTDDLNLPSEAGAVFESTAPSYLDLALQAAHEAPAIFANRTLLGAPAPITVTTSGGIGVSTGVTTDTTIRLGGASTTGVKTSGDVTFNQGRIENIAATAATAKSQTGAEATAGKTLTISDSSIVLDPKTTASVAITTNDLTGVRVNANGAAHLTGTQVVVGGGAKGNNNHGVVVTQGQLDMRGGSVSTQSWGGIGISLEGGAHARLDDVAVATTGVRSTTTGGAHGVRVSAASTLTANGGTIATSGGSAYGLRADQGATSALNDISVTTAGGNGHGVLADDARVTLSGGAISTTGKGSVGVWARNGAEVTLSGNTQIHTSGAAVSAATPVDDEKSLSLSHGLLANGAGTSIDADGVALDIAAGSASAARSEDGAQITLRNADIDVSGGATSTATTAALHALSGSRIDMADSTLDATGTNVGGIRAEGNGSQVRMSHSQATISGAGSVANPAAGARAMSGGSVELDHATLNVHGLTYGHGVSLEGAGSSGAISHSTVTVDGNRSIGLNISGGASARVDASSISVDAPSGAVGPWSPGVLVDGAGSTLQMSGSDVHTTPKTSYGVQVREGADATVINGSITTEGNYSTALAAGSSSSTAPGSTLTASNLTVTTHGNDNAMGIVADLGATVVVHGGSVTTTGSGSPVASNLTFPHGLAARNPGALLIADGTSVLTQGSQAYGAAVDDGGSMILDNLSVKTEGQYSVGLYAGIGSAKPGTVGLSASHVTVQTLGDHASGAMVSRQYKSETATLDLKDSSISTQGMGSHGLRAESGGALSASNSAVSTQGKQATGVFANNTASARLDGVSVNTQGDFGHGVVARQGGSVDA